MATPLALGFSGRTAEQAEAEWEAMSALKRGAMKAGDVSAAALFLASDEAAFVSGIIWWSRRDDGDWTQAAGV
ncbi:hypothetical protein ACMD2_22554 [Ananas comosus]|uniref:Uncharacterized protein n=1 Tax=Ananas comosus TaxID=4615 RepID=A0A199VIQ6_ANACO|nr:hypothetical protein ACMD2_22554 [Ananas comosus]